jgi:hypothetical protein
LQGQQIVLLGYIVQKMTLIKATYFLKIYCRKIVSTLRQGGYHQTNSPHRHIGLIMGKEIKTHAAQVTYVHAKLHENQ